MIRRLATRAVLLTGLAAAGLGCPPPKPAVNPAAIQASLPDDPAQLIERADVEFKKQNPDAMQVSLAAAEKAAAKERTYEALWRAARAASWLSRHHEKESKQAGAYAEKGRELAREATKLEPKRVEGHYYRGITAAQYAQAKGAREALPEVMEAANQAVEIDARYDHGGPLRLRGSVYAQAPAPPVSVGDPEEGVKDLERALAYAPKYPENQLLLGEALIKDDKLDQAEEAFKKTLEMPTDDPEWQHWKVRWHDQAQKGLSRIATIRRQRQGGGSPFGP